MKKARISMVLTISVFTSSALLAHDSGTVVDNWGQNITTGSGDCVVFGNAVADACQSGQSSMQQGKSETNKALRDGEPEVAKVIELTGLSFKTNSDVLDSSSNARLDSAVLTLNNNPDSDVLVAGHTDSSGDAAYNQSLSEKRANAVRNYLIEKGVDGSRLSVRGYGETEPVASNDTAAGRAKNRRVELRILK